MEFGLGKQGRVVVLVLATLLGLVVSVLTACGSRDRGRVDVFAAASLTNAFEELGVAFEQRYPDIDVRLNFAGSSSLREQVLDGAAADVFASANMSVMQTLVAEDAIDGSPVVMVANRLVLAVPAANPGTIEELEALETESLLIGACAAGVPCGDLATAVLDAAGIDASFDTLEPDVRSLARRLEAGEIDAGLVYRSDVVASNGLLQEVWASDSPAGRAEYPIAAVQGADEAAQSFIGFAMSDPGLAILARWGFEQP